MRQVWLSRKGGGEVLQIREADPPRPQPAEVRIAVEAAGVNFADVMMRRGLYPDAPRLPAVPGYEVAGTVDAVGEGVEQGMLGLPVVALCRFGGYSESLCVPRRQVWVRPEGVTAVHGAALPVNYLTAWQMVRILAPLGPEDRLLIHSAAGGVGQAVIQLARLAGARIMGSASPAKHTFLREQGLDHVFDSRQRHFASAVRAATGGRGVDVALEPRHGRWIMESYRCLAKCGKLVLFGFSSAAQGSGSGLFSAVRTLAQVPWLQLNPVRLMNDNRAVAGVNLGRMWDQHARTGQWMQQLLELLAAGSVEPRIDSVHAFDQAAEAHRLLEDRENVGKIVLVPGSAGGLA